MTFSIRKVLWTAAGVVLILSAVHYGSHLKDRHFEKRVSAASIPAPQPNSAIPAAIVLPPPTDQDVRQTIARIYGDAVQVADSGLHYVVGDFNGDESEDLAVEVRPVGGKLGILNDELANWILEDPSQIFVPDPNKKVQSLPPKPPRPQVRAGEPLLVIVHGFGAQGWREPMARQSYLLRHAAGREMVLRKKEGILADATASVHLFGDLIQSDFGGQKSFLFWTGGHYAWYRR